ncbi:MAG: hypothetical protein JO288_21440 [Hyphomicrobiales bacterium]|nr:hypothetical protein [Hyphomicrobiales bacterium]
MADKRSQEELMDLGAGQPAPEAVADLYRQAFREFGARSLWSRRPSAHPTIAQALAVAESLKRDGDMTTWALAARIEEACRSAL